MLCIQGPKGRPPDFSCIDNERQCVVNMGYIFCWGNFNEFVITSSLIKTQEKANISTYIQLLGQSILLLAEQSSQGTQCRLIN